jgi:hypothetical protein
MMLETAVLSRDSHSRYGALTTKANVANIHRSADRHLKRQHQQGALANVGTFTVEGGGTITWIVC